jgi:FlaA1/EpsC-like NDP-sugar epimerase
VPVRLWLADVRDRRKLDSLCRSARPEVVFHLAAYKHVPLGEENPDQAVEVNLAGVRALIESAGEHGAGRFVYPSSDKAVNPPSVYGSTKKLAEELTLAANGASGTGYSVVRFVNIVGTRGSVIETLTAQIAAGRPITLTDAGMTRYWITMPEAVRLLVLTGSCPDAGRSHMPDTGPAINLAEMAGRLYDLLTGGEYGECVTRFIGPRPGERMHEVLLSESERAEPTEYPGILRVETSRSERPGYGELSGQIDRLLEAARSGETQMLRGRLLEMANALQ